MIVKQAQVTLKDLKEFLSFYNDLETPLQNADTITKVMWVVQHKFSFINCVYFISIIICAKRFNISVAKEKINAYYKSVEKFCQNKLTQHSYVCYPLPC